MKNLALAALAAAALLAGSATLLSRPALAALGEDQGTVDDDRRALSGNLVGATGQGGYTVYEIVTATRTVREYVSNGGLIFGIAWQGINAPDLQPLLGRYYGELLGARQGREPGQPRRSHGEVQGPNLTLERSGPLRGVRGRAFVRALIPQGVSEHVIR